MMKRSIRIISLILIVGVIIAAFAISASAAVAPVVSSAQDFSTATVASAGSADYASGAGPSFGKWSLAIGQRNGTYSVVESKYDGNRYFRFDGGNSIGSGSYLYSYIDTKAEKLISTHSYDVLDFDIWAPTGSITNGTNIAFVAKMIKADGTAAFGSSNLPSLSIGNASGKNYLWWGGSSTARADFDNSVWNHVTIVLENAGKGSDGYLLLNYYVYLNGNLVLTKMDAAPKTNALSDYKGGDTNNYYIQDVRFNFPVGTSSDSIALDNLNLRSYTTAYKNDSACNLDEVIASSSSLTAWSDTVFTSSYVFPAATPTVELNGALHDSIERAEAVAKSGDVIKLVRNVDAITLSKQGVTLDTNGYTVGSVSGASGVSVIRAGTLYKATSSAVTQSGYMDFESVSYSGTYENASAANLNLGSGYAVVYKGSSHGKVHFTEEYGNNYMTYEFGSDAVAANLGPYISKYYTSTPSASTSHANYSLYAIEADVFFPTGKIADGTVFQFCHKNSSGWLTSLAMNIYHEDATGRNFIASSQSAADKLYLSENSWSHVTAILTVDSTGNTHTLKLYAFVDGGAGLLLATNTVTDATATITELRYQFNHNASNVNVHSGAAMSFDNMSQRIYSKSYDRTALDTIIAEGRNISEWYDSSYDPESKPYGVTSVKNGAKEYDSLAAAILDAEDGDTLTLVRSTSEEVFVKKNLTILTNGKTVGFVGADAGYVCTVDGSGNYIILDASNVDFAFEYISGGVTKQAPSGENALIEALTAADAGTTVKLLQNYTMSSSKNGAIVTVNKNLTLDLQGFSLTVNTYYQDATNNGQSAIHLGGSADLTVKNGTLLWGYTSNVSANIERVKAYPLFQYAGSGKLTLDGVDTYGGSIVFYWGGNATPTLNIYGGSHHSYLESYGSDTGFISTKANIDVNAEDAYFYLTNKSMLLSNHHKNASGVASSWIQFTNCTIIAPNPSYGIIYKTSDETCVLFDSCNIYGSITPQVATEGAYAATSIGYICITAGTRLAEGYTLAGDVEIDAGYAVLAESYTLSLTHSPVSGYYYDGSFKISDATSASYAFAYAVKTPPKTVTVKWYDKDGGLISSGEVSVGSVATPPTVDPCVESTGWYKISYNAWSMTAGGSAVTSFKINGETSFYQVKGDVEPYLTAAKFNLKLMTHMQLNFYLPVTLPEGVSIIGVYNSDGAAIAAAAAATVDGERYTPYTAAYVGAASIHNDTKITVKYTVTVDGKTHTLTQNVTLSPLRYIKQVLADHTSGAGAFTEAAHGVAANMLRYADAVMRYNGQSNSEITRLLNTYEAALCEPIDNTTDSDFPISNAYALGTLSDYIKSITVDISTYEPSYKIVFKDGARVTGMTMKCTGYTQGNYKGEGEVNWGSLAYTFSAQWGVYYRDNKGQLVYRGTVVDENGKTVSGATAGDTSDAILGVVRTQNIPIYNFGEDMTVILTLEDGGTVTGKYNIDTYYNGIKGTVSTDKLESARYFLKAMREYAEAVQEYRYPAGRVPVVDQDTDVINVKVFGAKGDGVTDDYAALKRAFDFAASIGYDVYVPDGTYYIGASCTNAITIKTNVDFGNAVFTLDDSKIAVGSAAQTSHIFKIASDYSTETYTPASGMSITASSTNIGYAPGYPALVRVYNDNVKHYIRYGENADSGSSQTEVFLVDKDGNIDPSTPVLYDFANVTKMELHRADDAPITVKGGTFNTKANQAGENDYAYHNRGILVQRSNVTIDGFVHTISGEGSTGAPYNGFIQSQYANNLTVKNATVQAHKAYYKKGSTSNVMGSYDISLSYSNDVKLINVIQSNFFNSSGSLTIDGDVASGTRYWGIMGTNYCKNLALDECTLSRFDAHCGVLNATIKNSTLAHITLIGGGDFRLENSTVYAENNQYLVSLRADYGSTWRGDMYFKDVTYKYLDSSATGVDLIGGTLYTDHYFGYNTYLPENIYIDNLKTVSVTRSGAGMNNERLGSENALDLGIFASFNNSMKSGVDYTTSNSSNKDPRTCTKNIYITNCSSLIPNANDLVIANHTFFKNMKIYIDGAAQSWSGDNTSSFGGSSGSDDGCFTGDTLITLADGTQKRADELEIGDMLLVWDHYSGTYQIMPAAVIENDGVKEYRVITLSFSDGTSTSLIYEHGYFDLTLGGYVYINEENAESFIGHEFARMHSDGSYTPVTLTRVEIKDEVVGCYSVVSLVHYNLITDGMLSIAAGIEGLFNIFEYDGITYSAEAVERDILEYGLYTYDDFSAVVSEEVFLAFSAEYLKVSVGKGVITYEDILYYIEKYLVGNGVV